MLLDLASDSGNGSNARSRKLCHLEARGKHIFDKGGMLVNLEWVTDKLQLFKNLDALVDVEHDSSSTNTEGSLKQYYKRMRNLHTVESFRV